VCSYNNWFFVGGWARIWCQTRHWAYLAGPSHRSSVYFFFSSLGVQPGARQWRHPMQRLITGCAGRRRDIIIVLVINGQPMLYRASGDATCRRYGPPNRPQWSGISGSWHDWYRLLSSKWDDLVPSFGVDDYCLLSERRLSCVVARF